MCQYNCLPSRVNCLWRCICSINVDILGLSNTDTSSKGKYKNFDSFDVAFRGKILSPSVNFLFQTVTCCVGGIWAFPTFYKSETWLIGTKFWDTIMAGRYRPVIYCSYSISPNSVEKQHVALLHVHVVRCRVVNSRKTVGLEFQVSVTRRNSWRVGSNANLLLSILGCLVRLKNIGALLELDVIGDSSMLLLRAF